jgi:hypothetical protein
MSTSRLLYGITVFLGAFLLFLVEPMAAKQILPILGGSSAVWITCLVFFQVALLLGYLYAHWITRCRASGWRRHMYLATLGAAAVLVAAQIAVPAVFSGNSDHPVRTIFATLGYTIGLPFLLLATTSPLLQVWFLRGEGRGVIPYRLFALSNAGSLLALVAYPIVVEPNVSLKVQRMLWSVGFLIYAALCAMVWQRSRVAARKADADAQRLEAASQTIDAAAQRTEAAPQPTTPRTQYLWTRWLWFLLPMAAAMQLCAVTAHLTVNIAAIPLLWMLPLAAYLLTFILAFEFPGFYRRWIVVRLLVVMLASLGYAISKTDVSLPIGLGIAFFLAECFVAGLFCHAETYALRPQKGSETTLFYLLIAAGGAAGTFFIGIVSPLIFSANYDLAITFFVTAALAVWVTWSDGWGQRMLWITASGLLLVFAIMLHGAYARDAILEVRNFYGTLRVKQTSTPQGDPERMLLNGTIQHGTQIFAEGLTQIPTTYYGVDSGIGMALRFCCEDRPLNLGVIGLGTGTLAAYGHAGDHIRFYEINPVVEPIARNLFTYLRDSRAEISVADGDARTSLTREAPQRFDVLAVDAFSGDAIPLHLLSVEAMELYKRHLAPNGIIAFHVSNQYLNLSPEIAELAIASNMQSRLIERAGDEVTGAYRSTWILLTNSPTFFERQEIATSATPTPRLPHLRAWTDNYSSLMPLLELSHH